MALFDNFSSQFYLVLLFCPSSIFNYSLPVISGDANIYFQNRSTNDLEFENNHIVLFSCLFTGGFQNPYNQNPYNHNPYCVGILIGFVGILIGSVGILIGFVGILIGSVGILIGSD